MAERKQQKNKPKRGRTTGPSPPGAAAPSAEAEGSPGPGAFSWAALPDAAFFQDGPGSPVQHAYLYGEVNDDSLRRLRGDIDAASAGSVDPASGVQLSPRPIVLHINSPGGHVLAGVSMMSVFNESRVPICACVDGISASAATFVSVLAPYRVMTPLASSMVHDYSSLSYGKASDVRFDTAEADALFAHVRAMYVRRTRLGAARLEELMQRDLMLDARRCVELGLCDRVLLLPPTPTPASAPTKDMHLPLSVVMRKTNLNHVRFECGAVDDFAQAAAQQLDRMLGAAAAAPGTLKAVVLHADGGSCLSSVTDHVAPLAARVQALGAATATYGVVDTALDVVNLLPILTCRRRVMYRHASVRLHLLYSRAWAWMLRDTIENTRMQLDIVRALLRAHTRLPAELVDGIDRRRVLLTAEDCLRWGVVDELV